MVLLLGSCVLYICRKKNPRKDRMHKGFNEAFLKWAPCKSLSFTCLCDAGLFRVIGKSLAVHVTVGHGGITCPLTLTLWLLGEISRERKREGRGGSESKRERESWCNVNLQKLRRPTMITSVFTCCCVIYTNVYHSFATPGQITCLVNFISVNAQQLQTFSCNIDEVNLRFFKFLPMSLLRPPVQVLRVFFPPAVTLSIIIQHSYIKSSIPTGKVLCWV